MCPVAIELGGIDASAEQVSILADHNASLAGIVGHGKAVVANGKLLVQLRAAENASKVTDVTAEVDALVGHLWRLG